MNLGIKDTINIKLVNIYTNEVLFEGEYLKKDNVSSKDYGKQELQIASFII